MSSISSRFNHDAQTPLRNYVGAALLIALVLLLAWLQFRWLAQLRDEEEARRRAALSVAATNYAESAAGEMNRLLALAAEGASLSDLIDEDFGLDAVIAFGSGHSAPSARISTRKRPTWSPARWAEVQQRLGRPLAAALLSGPPGLGLWLNPPAVVRCTQNCEAGVLSRGELADRVLGPPAERMFADFGTDLRLIVAIEGSGVDAVLYPSDVRVTDFSVTDLTQNLLPGVAVRGPPGAEWVAKINHGGSSLQAAVARSHVRNMLLSIGVLSLLVVSIGLVVSNARRQSALAREQLFFVAGISHELRTPLTVISTAAENLADNAFGEDERIRGYGELIHSEVRRLRQMIENVLQFAQSASALRPRLRTPVQIADLISRVIRENNGLLRDRDLRVEIAETLPTVLGDLAALESAVANLIVNAARYAEDGNWIAIRATVVRVRPRGRALRIAVTNPVGSVELDPDRLFEPFYRGQTARDKGPPGTGIGLAVARNVARQHGGGISVDTVKEGVITFSLLLPIHEHTSARHTPS